MYTCIFILLNNGVKFYYCLCYLCPQIMENKSVAPQWFACEQKPSELLWLLWGFCLFCLWGPATQIWLNNFIQVLGDQLATSNNLKSFGSIPCFIPKTNFLSQELCSKTLERFCIHDQQVARNPSWILDLILWDNKPTSVFLGLLMGGLHNHNAWQFGRTHQLCSWTKRTNPVPNMEHNNPGVSPRILARKMFPSMELR